VRIARWKRIAGLILLFSVLSTPVHAETQIVRSDWVCGDFDFNGHLTAVDVLKTLRASVEIETLECGFCPKECMSCSNSAVQCGCQGEVTCNESDVECVVVCNSTTCGFQCGG